MATDIRKAKKILFGLALLLLTYLICEFSAFFLYSVVEFEFPQLSEFQKQRLRFIAPDHVGQPLKRGVFMQFKTSEIIHPYFGYIRNPSTEEEVTEFGFPDLNGISLLEPISENTVVIGIFGGSFALNASNEGADALRTTLQRDPRFQDMDIIIHTLALGGYKQPQQLFSLGYLLSLGARFDIVVNLDGFNEVALPPIENVPKEEMQVAFNSESQMKHAVEQGYPFFRRYGRELSEQGIPFYDLTMIFAENDMTLYFDDCCHVNAAGSSLVGEAIGNAILEQVR